MLPIDDRLLIEGGLGQSYALALPSLATPEKYPESFGISPIDITMAGRNI
jgi:hypothetical protein